MSQICPICHNSHLLLKKKFWNSYLQQEYSLFECLTCETEHWSPLIHPKAEYYEQEALSIYKILHKGKREISDPRFSKFLRDFNDLTGKRFLDIGCSDGLLLKELESSGNSVWGIDIDSIALRVARKRGLENLFLSTVEDFVNQAKASNLTFDIITAFDVLEHLIDPLKTLISLKPLLNDGGLIVATVPNRNRCLTNLIKTDFPPHHFWRFSTTSLTNLFHIADFSIKQLEVFQYGYTNGIVIDLLWKRIKKLFRSQSSDSSPSHQASRSYVNDSTKKQVVKFVDNVSLPLAWFIEYPWQKGFKIYFVISKND